MFSHSMVERQILKTVVHSGPDAEPVGHPRSRLRTSRPINGTSYDRFIVNDLQVGLHPRYRRPTGCEGKPMRVILFVCAAIAAAMMPAAALADDPLDPAMRSAAARARDREIIRQLNRQELAMVRERDSRYAEGWRATRIARSSGAANGDYAARSRDHDEALADYARSRAKYEREMAEWRRAVAACRQGDDSACAN